MQHKAVYRIENLVSINTSGNDLCDFIPSRPTSPSRFSTLENPELAFLDIRVYNVHIKLGKKKKEKRKKNNHSLFLSLTWRIHYSVHGKFILPSLTTRMNKDMTNRQTMRNYSTIFPTKKVLE